MYSFTGEFRHSVINEGHDSETFSHPINLLKLALFIQEAFVQQNPTKKLKPLVLCCFIARKKSYLVVGVVEKVSIGNIGYEKNWFGTVFKEAAEASGASIVHDAFETAFLEVRRDDLQNFLNVIHLSS